MQNKSQTHVSCTDGIANLEPPYESLFDVDVKSAVDKAFPIMEPIRAPDAPFSFKSTVVVGEDWDVLPSVRLVDAQGSPVAGKEVIMMVDPQSADKEFDDLGILYSALASNADGWVYFTFARVAFAVREGAYTFRVLYDLGSKGPPTATVFTLNVVYPTTPDLRQCTFVQVNGGRDGRWRCREERRGEERRGEVRRGEERRGEERRGEERRGEERRGEEKEDVAMGGEGGKKCMQ